MDSPLQRRASGILLHPSSLPGNSFVGDLGKNAYRFVDFLSASGFHYWQILPTGPTDCNFSPYQSSSAFAGNNLFISLEKIAEMGLLETNQTASRTRAEHHRALKLAHKNFEALSDNRKNSFLEFCEREHDWLEGYASFSAIKNSQEGKPWFEWPAALRNREQLALQEELKVLQQDYRFYLFEQWLYEQQWQSLSEYAKSKDIQIIGDIAIFVAHDSADVWEHQQLFRLDESGLAIAVAGVPPDYFSETGQRWGNPLYNWSAMEKDGFQWWKNRISHLLKHVSLLRIDHFRGFEACWEIPATEETAINGVWRQSPGKAFFQSLSSSISPLPIIAEDLGIITPEVEALRDEFKLPGMKILQFAFDSDSKNPYLPHNHVKNSVIFTGTHDNNTSLGWFNHLPSAARKNFQEYLSYPIKPMPWPLIQSALASVGQLAIIPFQDLLCLNEAHRMNTPGTVEGNWRWRFQWEDIPDGLDQTCRQLNQLYGRL